MIEKIKNLEIIINEKLKSNDISVKILEDDKINKSKIFVFKRKMIERVFQLEEISFRQVIIKENNEVLEESLHIDNLVKWLYNLYNPVEILYIFYGGDYKGKILTRHQVDKIAIGQKNSIQLSSLNKEELKQVDDQPIVKGYLGPMFEKIDYGKIYLRFETQEIYDMLSA